MPWLEEAFHFTSLVVDPLTLHGHRKTRIYLERSKSSPLKVYLREEDDNHYPFLDDAFLLTVPHIGRLGSLSLIGSEENFIKLVNKHFNRPAPFLEKLRICFSDEPHTIMAAIFDGNLSSVRELRLSGVLTDLSWKNLANLTKFELCHVPSNRISVTQLLDFFERAPLLSNIRLLWAFPTTSDAPFGRVVSLPHLKKLNIDAKPVHSILLEHLSVPSGAPLVLVRQPDSEGSRVLDYLPKSLKHLNNLSCVTSINLRCSSVVSLQLDGPSGRLSIFAYSGAAPSLRTIHSRFLRSLNHFNISMVERLMIMTYDTPLHPGIENSSVYQTLFLMNALRTLILIDCLNAPFISALNPSRTSGTLVCPVLEELVLYVEKEEWFCVDELLGMVKERNSRGARLSTITIVSSPELMLTKKVLKLRDHVSRVEYKLDDVARIRKSVLDDFDHESDW